MFDRILLNQFSLWNANNIYINKFHILIVQFEFKYKLKRDVCGDDI